MSELTEWTRLFLGYAVGLLGLASIGFALLVWLGSSLSEETLSGTMIVLLVILGALGLALLALCVMLFRRSTRPPKRLT